MRAAAGGLTRQGVRGEWRSAGDELQLAPKPSPHRCKGSATLADPVAPGRNGVAASDSTQECGHPW